MKINRHNYEEYFMLYVDGELLPEQRIWVDEFVQQNPDLKNELELIISSVLPVQHIEFMKKESLIKAEVGIDMSNYQTYFLLYADNELNDFDKISVEKFVLQHPDVQREFTTLQQAILQPDFFEFTNKKALFRTEKQESKGAILWFKFGVAAAVIGFIFFSASLFLQKDFSEKKVGFVAANSTKDIIKNQSKPIQNPNSNNIIVKKAHQLTTKPQSLVQNQVNNISKTSIAKRAIQNSIVSKYIKNKIPEASAQTVQVSTQEKVNKANVLQNESNTETLASQTSANISMNPITESITENAPLTQPKKLINADEYPIVHNAVYRELDISEDERTMYIGSAAINKNKLRGLFKKVSRLMGKSTTESEKF